MAPQLNLIVEVIHSIQTVVTAAMSGGFWKFSWDRKVFDVSIVTLYVSSIKQVEFLVDHFDMFSLSVFEKFNVIQCLLAGNFPVIGRIIALHLKIL